MATINLDVEKINSINNELDSLSKTLTSNYVPNLKDTIGEIRNNVQNEQINSILTTITTQVDSITNDITTQLPRLHEFLESQMRAYSLTESEAEARLNAVVQKMDTLSVSMFGEVVGNATAAVEVAAAAVTGVASTLNGAMSGVDGSSITPNTSSDTNSYSETAAEESTYDHGWGGKYAETWTSWWGDVQEAYEGTDGAISFVGNTLEAACDTVGALGETVIDVLSDGCHIIGNVVGWLFS